VIRDLLENGKSKAAIARELAISRRTVFRRVLEIRGAPQPEKTPLPRGAAERTAASGPGGGKQPDRKDDTTSAGTGGRR
jgi:DNA invertase Pin-like site-specific DNA recombinase